jgi:pyruvate dehydrogenase E1 component alpha subunit
MTYRYRGHSMSDPQKYRSKEEVSKIRAEHDPIDRVRDRLLEDRLANEEQLKEIDKEVRAVVNDAAEFAQNCPEPASAELFADVYA